MTHRLAGARVAFLTANEGIEQVELTEPWDAVRDAGGTPVLATPGGGFAQAMNHMDKADLFESGLRTSELSLGDYAGVVLPGGVANPDQLRTDAAAVTLVREALATGLPVASICHGPWTIVEADGVRGRTLTSWPSLRTDIVNAGGTWVDRTVMVCLDGPGPLVTSRKPDDLPEFCDAMLGAFAARLAGARR